MGSHEIGLVTPHRFGSGMNSQLLFHDHQFALPSAASTKPRCHVGDPPQTRELGEFLVDKSFSRHRDRYMTAAPSSGDEFHHSTFADAATHPRDRTPSSDGSDEDEDYDNDDIGKDGEEVEEEYNEAEAFSPGSNPNRDKNAITIYSDNVHNSSSAKMNCSDDSNMEMLVEDNSFLRSANSDSSGRVTENHHHHQCGPITVAEPQGGYHLQFLHGREGQISGQKELAVDNDCSISGRKNAAYSNEVGESLMAILSDPLTGSLMDDAMILRCGHSFGGIGMQHVLRMKACFTCSAPVTENSVIPNILLRAAAQAFRREETFCCSSKKRKDRGSYGDSYTNHHRVRGVHFPFAVTDRVIIKGNKRTPERFVGREAIVTTQCLNGWYVVKTLDSAESVKVQYSSLHKSTQPKTTNWL